ncbi:putative sucrose utilization protein [Penicillium chrysogenum]|uniref:Putative sucrose utilization protein n=1 Tax=Penicillium chrysogenum TaxID=5076 RepID=A0A167RWD4_PENCH|nr:putative sucrose utilization protein [Penicillium chrysogenum]
MPDPPVKQACDACRRRKVKCIFPKPCEQCRAAGLVCRTTSQRQKKGRQGQTANILNELRANQIEQALVRDANMPPQSPALTLGDNIPTPQSLRASGRCQFSKKPGLLSRELVDSCSGYFFLRMRGTVPVLQPGSFQKQVDLADTSLHAYCLVTAFCAFVVTQTGFAVEQISSELSQGFCTEEFRSSLIEEATEARKHIDPFTDPVRQSIIIAFLLYGCHIGLGNQRHAYYFLRESTTLYTASALESQASSAQTDDDDPSLAGKLFWLLVVAHAIRRHRPITLQVTPGSPQLEDGPLPTQLEDDPLVNASAVGFRCLVNLYRPFDEGFLDQWNGTNATCTVESLVRLEELIQSAVPADLDLPDILMADLRVSQQWLRIMIWQLSTTAGFLSTNPTHECMDFRYPLLIAQDLCFATWKLSRQSMETHGIGLIEKIFEVACTLIDVMACLSAAGLRSSGFKLGPQDYLKHFFTLIHDLPGGRRRFLPLLLTKIGQTLPSMVDPITVHLKLQPSTLVPRSTREESSISATAGNEISNEQPSAELISESEDWMNGNFNYAEMSRIGEKTPEIDEAFLQYSSYFP